MNNTDSFSMFDAAYKDHQEFLHKKNLQYKETSKERLALAIETKLRTTFIGALDSIEKKLGYLWGIGLPQYKLNYEEKEFRLLWEELRQEILDKGNNQLRAIINEISEYEIVWKKKQYNFTIGAKDE